MGTPLEVGWTSLEKVFNESTTMVYNGTNAMDADAIWVAAHKLLGVAAAVRTHAELLARHTATAIAPVSIGMEAAQWLTRYAAEQLKEIVHTTGATLDTAAVFVHLARLRTASAIVAELHRQSVASLT